jgi:hypothetical protein
MPINESAGGSGGESIQPTTRDVRLLARALGEHWPIPEDTRQAMMARKLGAGFSVAPTGATLEFRLNHGVGVAMTTILKAIREDVMAAMMEFQTTMGGNKVRFR